MKSPSLPNPTHTPVFFPPLVISGDAGGCLEERATFLEAPFPPGGSGRGLTAPLCSPLPRSTLEGYYADDALQGQGVYTYEDGGVLQGTYVDGELNGPAQEYDTDGRLIFKGQYKDNIRHGVCWIYYPVSLATARGAGK